MPRSRYDDLSQDAYDDPELARGGGAYISRGGSTSASAGEVAQKVLCVLSYIFRALALISAFVVCMQTFGVVARYPFLSSLNGLVNTLTPHVLRGILSFISPFGGVFRGDFCITSLMLFALDFICMRIASSLR